LAYPDPRVQLAAALALLNLPNVNHGANARIIEILSRAGGSETSASPMTKGKAVIADPTSARGDQLANLLRQIGYDTELIGSGRELIRRMKTDASIDLVVLDRHIVEPTLSDLLVHLSSDSNSGRRPVMVVASADQVQPLGIEQLLARLAVLVATTETNEYTIPPSYTIDRRKTKDENDELRKAVVAERDKVFKQIVDARVARTKRIVAAAKLPPTPEVTTRVDLRITQLTVATLISEYEPTPDTAPNLFRELAGVTALISRQKQNDAFIDTVTTNELGRLILQLESAITPDMVANFQRLRNATDYAALGLSARATVDPNLVEQVKRQVRSFKGVSVITEPYATSGLADDIAATMQDPAQMPRDPAEKKAAALAALDALRRLASGSAVGYDLRPAIPALRQAIANDDTAEAAITTLGFVNSAEAQQDLIRLATAAIRKPNLRSGAIDSALHSVQAYGRMGTPVLLQALTTAIAAESSPELKAKLSQLKSVFATDAKDWTSQIMGYKVLGPTTPPTAPTPMETKPPVEEKKEN
jgi:CheY-like chemotaxis protein